MERIDINDLKEMMELNGTIESKSYLLKFIDDLKDLTMNEIIELESAIENEKNNRYCLDI